MFRFALNIRKIEDLIPKVFTYYRTSHCTYLGPQGSPQTPAPEEKKSRPLLVRKFLDLPGPKIILKSLYLVYTGKKIKLQIILFLVPH